MQKFQVLLPLIILLTGVFCTSHDMAQPIPETSRSLENPPDSLLFQRFAAPSGYRRLTADPASFAHYLRNLPLKPHGSLVRYFDGDLKQNHGVYEAVVDLPIGRKNLHQCADAVIRLRAEYLWKRRDFDQITFHFTNGFPAEYHRWRKGERIKVKQNQACWVASAAPSDSYQTFWDYLEMVFSYAGTLSLDKELHSKPLTELEIGDVFIRGGSPGHAVIVVDVAVSEAGKKVFLLAQSYMPAQELQILKNPNDPKLSPWYSADFGETLHTPEWSFQKAALKGF
jgi:hypothetical protein